MICRFKTHQSQPSIALSRSERTCRVVVETGTKTSTSKTAIIKTHLLCSMFLVAPKLHQKKKWIWISMLQIPRMESPMIICWQTALSSFVTIPKPKLFKITCSPHTAITGLQNWREHQRRRRCRSTSDTSPQIVGMKHTTRSELMKDIQDKIEKEQEPYSKRQVQLI